jgi:hypothetical protein
MKSIALTLLLLSFSTAATSPQPRRLNCIPTAAIAADFTGDGGGILFKGCKDADDLACGLPRGLINGLMEEAARYPPRKWKDLPADAFYRQLTGMPGTKFEPRGESLIVSNEGRSHLLLLWHSSSGHAQRSNAMADDDELVAVCEKAPLAGTRVADYTCRRDALLGDVYLNYSFWSNTPAPDVIGWDARMKRVLDAWRCADAR